MISANNWGSKLESYSGVFVGRRLEVHAGNCEHLQENLAPSSISLDSMVQTLDQTHESRSASA